MKAPRHAPGGIGLLLLLVLVGTTLVYIGLSPELSEPLCAAMQRVLAQVGAAGETLQEASQRTAVFTTTAARTVTAEVQGVGPRTAVLMHAIGVRPSQLQELSPAAVLRRQQSSEPLRRQR